MAAAYDIGISQSAHPTADRAEQIQLAGQQWVAYYHGKMAARRHLAPYSADEETSLEDA